jgi:hypothetical protein
VLTSYGSGHSELDLAVDQLKYINEEPIAKYYLVDANTKQIVRKVQIEEGMDLMMIPVIGED